MNSKAPSDFRHAHCIVYDQRVLPTRDFPKLIRWLENFLGSCRG